MDDLFDISPEMELSRLQAHLDNAEKHAREMNEHAVEGSIEIGKEKTQYFEKIALASGGTIALVVSFVGSHTGKLQPWWLLRAALVALLLSMFAGMYRNWKYPFYMYASYLLEHLKAMQETGRWRAEIVRKFGSTSLSSDDGKPVDVEQSLTDLKEVEAILEGKVAECKKNQTSAIRLVGKAEIAALVFIASAMVLLLALAWMNF
ncbi:MAG TPA: hypothetical protein VN776_14085 [Terracidiphilus sp.]|nr:hypothetical protein [Terracidiphilus sp.]